jgi:hypothetical protein
MTDNDYFVRTEQRRRNRFVETENWTPSAIATIVEDDRDIVFDLSPHRSLRPPLAPIRGPSGATGRGRGRTSGCPVHNRHTHTLSHSQMYDCDNVGTLDS